MTCRLRFLTLLLGLMAARPAWADEALLTLADCYALARGRSEELAIRQELVVETEGRFLQAMSGALPDLTFSSSDKRQDGSGSSAFTLRDVPERKLVLNQPLFAGFKEFAAMAGSRAERRQRVQHQRRAEQLLFLDVSEAFYLLRQQREELYILEMTRTTLLARIDELEARERLGRSRPSEISSAEAQLRRVEAELEQVRGREATARQLLEFLTGREPIEGIVDLAPDRPSVDPVAASLERVKRRSDVAAVLEATHIAKEERVIARSKFFPTVNLEGNYYVERAGAAEEVAWDVVLKAEVPLFQGGEAVGGVKEAKSRERQVRLALEKIQREARLDIRNAYAELGAALARYQAFLQALEAAEENYRLQAADYRISLVNNLDVLQALEALEETQRNVIQARVEVKRRYWRLRVATGETL